MGKGGEGREFICLLYEGDAVQLRRTGKGKGGRRGDRTVVVVVGKAGWRATRN